MVTVTPAATTTQPCTLLNFDDGNNFVEVKWSIAGWNEWVEVHRVKGLEEDSGGGRRGRKSAPPPHKKKATAKKKPTAKPTAKPAAKPAVKAKAVVWSEEELEALDVGLKMHEWSRIYTLFCDQYLTKYPPDTSPSDIPSDASSLYSVLCQDPLPNSPLDELRASADLPKLKGKITSILSLLAKSYPDDDVSFWDAGWRWQPYLTGKGFTHRLWPPSPEEGWISVMKVGEYLKGWRPKKKVSKKRKKVETTTTTTISTPTIDLTDYELSEGLPQPKPYRIEKAVSGRARCKRCDATIPKDTLRIGMRPLFRGKPGFLIWYHLRCTVFDCSEVKSGEDISYYEDLEEVRKI
ncbi:hypothetical protein TL16_g05356 [Triparma laevis f. inornata]|uniref:PARP-type domain-containing protein n=1 Tax=Triparma laevis f. inornata TaxID=1714386 RepID=A0A9W7EBM0_9STRA|nr:hypothetical protein TL16_g05356 [Triparma laevis f. inornata]